MLFERAITCVFALCVLGLPAVATADDDEGSKEEREGSEDEGDSAVADQWRETFPPGAAASYLPDEDDRGVVVVAAGDHDEVEDATSALAASLREGGDVDQVMDDDALGDVSEASDDEIVEKSENLPVPFVITVRVFDSGEGAAPSVAVTYHDNKKGESIDGVSTNRGELLQPADDADEEQTSGVNEDAARAVEESTDSSSKQVEDAREKFLEEFVWFENITGINQSGAVVAQWSNAYRGKYREPLRGAKYYEAVGRDDLADEYRSRNTIRWGTTIGLYALVGFSYYQFISSGLSEYDSDPSWFWGGVGIVSIFAASFFPFLYKVHPVDPPEARRLAEEHNEDLQEELGLSDTPDEAPMNFSIGVGATPDTNGEGFGGGLQLRGRF